MLEVRTRVFGPSIFVCWVRTSVRAAKSPVGRARIFVHDSSERVLGASDFVCALTIAAWSVLDHAARTEM